MDNMQTLYKGTSLLFALVALITVMGHSHDMGMAAVWLALSAVFLAVNQQAKSRS